MMTPPRMHQRPPQKGRVRRQARNPLRSSRNQESRPKRPRGASVMRGLTSLISRNGGRAPGGTLPPAPHDRSPCRPPATGGEADYAHGVPNARLRFGTVNEEAEVALPSDFRWVRPTDV